MKTKFALVLALSTTTLLSATEAAFYTQTSWTSSNLSGNWNTLAGTPDVTNGLENSTSDLNTPTRIIYKGATPSLDYAVSSVVSCYSWTPPLGNPVSYHYLRASSTSWYEIQYSCNNVSVYLHMGGVSYNIANAYTSESSALIAETAILGSTITVTMSGSQVLSVSDSTLTSGGIGVGSAGCNPGWYVTCGIGAVNLLFTDSTPPTVPAGLTGVAYAARVNLAWSASCDQTSSTSSCEAAGVTGYKVYRADPSAPSTYNYIGASSTLQFNDGTVDPIKSYNYKVTAYDLQNNESAQSTAISVTTVGSAYAAPDVGSPQDWASN